MPPFSGGTREPLQYWLTSAGLLVTLTNPATWGQDCDPRLVVQSVPVLLASGANREVKRTPADAVESLEAMVLLTMFTISASCSDTPAPSQPATSLVMMLLVTLTEFHLQFDRLGQAMFLLGKLSTSVPLMFCNRRPPPLPLSAALPMIRLAFTTRPGPVPSLGGI